MTATGENIRSILTKDPAPEGPAVEPVGQRTHRLIASLPTWVLWVLVLVWTVPSFGLLVRFRWPVPSAFMTKMSQFPVRFDSNATCFPSRDQTGSTFEKRPLVS